MEGARSQTITGATLDNVNNVSIMYFNARSLVPKLDELCLLVELHNPDIISIVESWLCADISDAEIGIWGCNAKIATDMEGVF